MRPALVLLPVLAVPLLALPSSAAQPKPVFVQYHAPATAVGAASSGEPSLGIDSRTGNVMFMSAKSTWRVHGFGPKADSATWDDVTDPVIGAQTSDPILYTDPVTNRTFANQLELQGGSLQAYTDDDGSTWTHSTMGGAIGLSFDHQTIVASKPVAEGGTLPKPIGYPDYLHYCTNDLYGANCGTSIDGGLNFLAAVPVYTGELAGGPCAAIFGHIKSDPRDGTVYLPPNGCNGKQMLFVSRDNTLSWTGYTVPGSTDGDSGHPSVGVGRADGAVYYAWGSADGWQKKTGRVQVAASFDHGKTWTAPKALGAELGVVTSRFPVVVAGDPGRAAVAFLGAKADGDPSAAPDPTTPSVKAYTGTWDLYVSYTLDKGKTWTTYDATPGDPIQRGPVCTRGTTCLAGRNLLDFNDMVLDSKGYLALALADGATAPGDTYAADKAAGLVVRQTAGPSLYAGSVSKPVTKPAAKPPTTSAPPPASGGSAGPSLATTGLGTAAPVAALLLLAAAVAVRRRRVSPA